jgi:hypothetical protein
MPRQLLVTTLFILVAGGCSSECHIKSPFPKDEKQAAVLKDAQTRSADHCRSPLKCEYRIVQSPEGAITIHVDQLYDAPGGSGCGGDTFLEWSYNAAGEFVEGA